MNVLLTGANGFIGRNVARALVADGHQVNPVSRAAGCDFVRMCAPADWLPRLRDIDAVINCVGIIGERGAQRFDTLHAQAPLALFAACAQAGVRRVTQISALGADETAFSAFHLSKRAADDGLRRMDLDWFVLRPSLIYGPGSRSAALFMRMARWPLIPVLGNGRQVIQPVHISDVVATVMHCLTSPVAQQTIDVLGTEAISFADWLRTMRHAQGLAPTRLMPVPFALAGAIAWVARTFSPLLQPDNVRMLRKGYRADAGALTQFLGRAPARIDDHLFFTDLPPSRSTS